MLPMYLLKGPSIYDIPTWTLGLLQNIRKNDVESSQPMLHRTLKGLTLMRWGGLGLGV